jgi:glycerophosphoryl diester phosphodiesterase
MLPKRIKTWLVLLLILLIVYDILCWVADPAPDHPYFQTDKFLVIAHRGGRSLGPEGTLYTFRKAVDLGVDVLEMDVRSTADGQLIILHDRALTRTTGTAGLIENFTLSEVKKLDAAYHWTTDSGRSFPLRNTGIRIPTVAEVFQAFSKTKMIIEIKDYRSDAVQSLCGLIRDHQMSEKVMVASFETDSLKEFRSLCPRVATSAPTAEATLFYILQRLYLEAAYSPEALVLQVPEALRDLPIVTRRFIEAAHARNMRVQVWTVNDINSMKRLVDLGVDGIMTDYPQRLLKVINNQ